MLFFATAHIHIYFFILMESAAYYYFINIILIYGYRLYGDIGYLVLSVVEPGDVVKALASGELDRTFGSQHRKLFNRLIDRHELSSLNDPLTSLQVGILSCCIYRARKSALGQSMDDFSREGVITAHDGFRFFNGINIIINKIVSDLRLPLITVAAGEDFKIVVLASFVKSVHDLFDVEIGVGAHDLDDAGTVFDLLADTVPHRHADRFIVERDIKTASRIPDYSVVAYDRNTRIFGLFYDRREGVRIDGNYYYRVHPALDEILDLGDLRLHISVGRLDIDFRPETVSRRNEHVAVPDPTLDYERVKAHSYGAGIILGRLIFAWSIFLTLAGGKKEYEYQKERYYRFLSHLCVTSLYSVGVTPVTFLNILEK